MLEKPIPDQLNEIRAFRSAQLESFRFCFRAVFSCQSVRRSNIGFPESFRSDKENAIFGHSKPMLLFKHIGSRTRARWGAELPASQHRQPSRSNSHWAVAGQGYQQTFTSEPKSAELLLPCRD